MTIGFFYTCSPSTVTAMWRWCVMWKKLYVYWVEIVWFLELLIWFQQSTPGSVVPSANFKSCKYFHWDLVAWFLGQCFLIFNTCKKITFIYLVSNSRWHIQHAAWWQLQHFLASETKMKLLSNYAFLKLVRKCLRNWGGRQTWLRKYVLFPPNNPSLV